MTSSLKNTLLNSLTHLRMCLIKQFLWNPLIEKTRNPQKGQNDLLKKILSKNGDTVFGRAHEFEKIRSHEDYINAVPVQSYEDLREYIEKQEEENSPYLNSEQPIMYAQTSGTTGKPKYISILKSSISQYRKSQRIFAYAQYASISGVYSGKVLGIVSPAVEGFLKTGTPFGSMSGLIYKSMPRVVRAKYAVPPEVFEIEDYELKYYLITAFALAEDNITIMATANPSTLLKISNIIEKHAVEFIHDIKFGTLACVEGLGGDQKRAITQNFKKNPIRAKELEGILCDTGKLIFADIWPNMKAVATWTGGSCSVLISSLRRQLSSSTHIVEMGYLSSEFRGSITIDVLNNMSIPTLHENFFEFVEKEKWEKECPNFLPLEHIEEGKQYYVFVTTQSGLYRYAINDIIEVTGMYNNTPTIQFVQKGKGVTNLTGEKLYESQLTETIEAIKQEKNLDISFFVMLADEQRLEYRLYIEHEPFDESWLLERLEQLLCQLNIEYHAKRLSGRLHPVKIKFLKAGAGEAYKKHCVQSGQREGQFKVAHLQYKQDCTFDFVSESY